MVGDGRRLATELVVIMASATQEIHALAGARVRAAACSADRPIGMSAVLNASTPSVSSSWSMSLESGRIRHHIRAG
jgi:hypothetical protein